MPRDCRSAPVVPIYHVITPGDHYSPKTGSAVPTVVHGLAGAAGASTESERWPQHVVVQAGTWAERYTSASPVEYVGGPPPSRRERVVDAAVARLGRSRPFASRAYRPISNRLRGVAAGVVVAHNGAALALLMRDCARHAVVLYAHNDLFRSFSRREAMRTVASCRAVVCVSETLRQAMSARVPARLHDRFHVVRNGVDIAQFSPAEHFTPSDRLRVGFVGRMIPDKGADILARAAGELAREDIEFVFIGSAGFDAAADPTDYEVAVRRLADAVPHVTFFPFTDRAHLPGVLRGLDVLVVPSRWAEPWALTVGEGLASGLAVVASRAGGIPEQVGDAGILVRPDDPVELGEVLARLADDRTRVRELGLLGRQRALAHDWAVAWRAFTAVLESMETGDERG